MNTKREPRIPFLVTGGECKKLLDDIDKDNHEAWLAQADFAKKYGCTQFYGRPRLCGLHCEGEIPEGWIHRKKDPAQMIVPRTKALKDEMRALPVAIDAIGLADRLNCPELCDGDHLYWPFVETVGELALSPEGSRILWIPTVAVESGYVPPEGATRMKMSEYWALKEQAGDSGDADKFVVSGGEE